MCVNYNIPLCLVVNLHISSIKIEVVAKTTKVTAFLQKRTAAAHTHSVHKYLTAEDDKSCVTLGTKLATNSKLLVKYESCPNMSSTNFMN